MIVDNISSTENPIHQSMGSDIAPSEMAMSIFAWVLVLTSRPVDFISSEIKLMIGLFLGSLYLKHRLTTCLFGAVGLWIRMLCDDGSSFG